MPKPFYVSTNTIKKVLKQQQELFKGNHVKNRIIHIYRINFIYHLEIEAFNEGTRLISNIGFVQELFNTKI